MTKTEEILLGVHKSDAGMTYQNYAAKLLPLAQPWVQDDNTGTEISEPDFGINTSCHEIDISRETGNIKHLSSPQVEHLGIGD